MKSIELNIPDALDLDASQASLLLASRLYEQGKVSLGHAAELSGMGKRAFAELLGSYGVSLFNYPPAELAHDVANA